MKRKLFLGILPAILVLSSCQAGPKVQTKENLFRLEDTLAHEEVFGKAEFGGNLGVKKAVGVAASEADVAVTAQFSSVVDNKISIRFVAAINISGELGDNEAKWTRVMYDADGNNVKASADNDCIHAYTSVKNGAETLSIDSFNSSQGKAADYYDYFVVYTMVDIPYSTCQNYRLGAYLTLNDTVVSKQLITTVKNDQQWVFNGSHSGFFLKGTFNSVAGEKNQDSSTKGDNPSNNFGSFTVDLFEDDTFKIVQCDDSKFRFIDSSCLTTGSGGTDGYFVDNSGDIKVDTGKSGYYVLYLNKDPHLYLTYKGAFYYIRGDAAGDSTFSETKEAYRLTSSADDNNIAEILDVHLEVGDFKIANPSWSVEWGFWGCYHDGYNDWLGDRSPRIVMGGASSHFVASPTDQGGDRKNIYCNEEGDYNIFVTVNNYIYFEYAN